MAALACPAYEVGFGGSVAGGKSWTLALGPLRYVQHKHFKAKLFRRTYPQLEGSLLPETAKIYPRCGAVYNASKHVWTFPSGAQVQLSHLQHSTSIQDHWGQPYQFLGLDEITTFELDQVRLLQGWLRSADGIPIRFRWGSNPVDDDSHWLLKRYMPWIIGALPRGHEKRRKYKGLLAAAGQILWVKLGPGDEEIVSETEFNGSMSRTFFPAKLSDNQILMAADPGYADRVRATGEVNSRRLLEGDWFARDSAGAMFDQADFDRFRVEAAPHLARVGVGVDPAVSNTARSDQHGIIVGGISEDQHIYLLDDWSRRGEPNEWAAAVHRAYTNHNADQVIAEKNQGGDMVKSTIHSVSNAIPVQLVTAWRGKQNRLEPFANLAKQGRVHIVGSMPDFEAEARRWIPSGPNKSTWSPNRLDAFGHLGAWLVGDGIDTDEDEHGPARPPNHPDTLLAARMREHEAKQARKDREEDPDGEDWQQPQRDTEDYF